MKLLFLYTEVSDYFLSCINVLSQTSEADIHIVNWAVNKEAPFQFSISPKLKTYNRSDLDSKSLTELAKEIAPDLIYSSGWMDRDYLSVCQQFNGHIPVVVGFDNKWRGSIKQRLGIIFSNLTIHKYFSYCWIPGNPQYEFARRLGFKKENIFIGFYTCNFDLFHNLYLKYKESKKKKFPHRLLFVGRYVEAKGINDLWKVFIELQKENPNDWELWCLGTGTIAPIIHPKIKHFGFVQPKDIEKFTAEAGVFILPSTFEPWGVAVHEFASAGFPLLCSNEVGAADMFLKERENGFIFKAGDISGLKDAIKKIFSLTDEQLFSMGERSADLAKQITPYKWTDTLMSIMKENI